MKIKFHNQPESFLGLYAQISMNNVQGQDYPYFYVVLVAKRESGLIAEIAKKLNTPENVISELSSQEDSEVLVIRQYTTKKSGYHTPAKAINTIFDCGLETCKKHFN
ncbi:MAG: hypothetical protein HC905_31735 [Bacteroidales bacterium]|nr:hypothetical protein [Bacteroidales bacterium]